MFYFEDYSVETQVGILLKGQIQLAEDEKNGNGLDDQTLILILMDDSSAPQAWQRRPSY